MSLPDAGAIGVLVAVGEFAIGIALVAGLFTRPEGPRERSVSSASPPGAARWVRAAPPSASRR